MSSQAQIDANRLNSQKSTGPSQAARTRTRWNALKSGIHAKSIVLPCENQADYDQLSAGMTEEHLPVTPTERALVDMMTVSIWRFQRLVRLEAEVYKKDE